MSRINLLYQLIVKDKNGKIIRKTRFKRSKSFVLQFLQLLEIQLYYAGIAALKRTDGTSDAETVDVDNFRANGGVGLTTFGVVVGTGTTSPTSADYVMETLIAHGVGAGQLSYGATSKTAAAVVGANVDFILTRTFNNGSGNTINVTEAGLYCYVSNAGKYAMIIHDVFSAVAVTNGQTLTVNYTFRTTV